MSDPDAQPSDSEQRFNWAPLAVVAFGIIAVVLGWFFVEAGNVEPPGTRDTRVVMSSLEKSVKSYRAAAGALPTQSEGLKALLAPPDGRKPLIDAIPVDAWGNQYTYLAPARQGTTPFEIVSHGPDGTFGTDDDISSASRR